MELTRRAAVSGASALGLVKPSQAITAAEWRLLADGLRRTPASWRLSSLIVFMVASMPHDPAPSEVVRDMAQAVVGLDNASAFLMACAAIEFATRSPEWAGCARICHESAMRCVEIAEATV